MSGNPRQWTPLAGKAYDRRRLGAIAARWDARAEAWDRDLDDPACHLNEDDAYRRFLREIDRVIERRRGFCARHGVIDVGCGTGLVLAQVISAFAWGVGVDISEQMIRVAEEKRIRRARFILGDCFGLPAVCPRAGAVLSRGVLLSHYGRRQGEQLLKASKAALVSGGFLVFDFLNEAGRKKHKHAPENKTYFTRNQACAMARRAGFQRAFVLGEEDRRVLILLAREDLPRGRAGAKRSAE